MTKRLMRTSLIAGCLATGLDEFLGGRVFGDLTRNRLRLETEQTDIEGSAADAMFEEIRTLAIAQGMPACQYDKLHASAATLCDAVVNTPGAIEKLRKLQAMSDQMSNARRKASRN